MAQWVKGLLEDLSSDPRSPIKSEMVMNTCNPRLPTARWKKEAGKIPWKIAGQLASHTQL